jgi:uncharacterized membrane protein YgcG
MRSGTWSIVAIAVLGLVLAVALGIFADTIARGTVALPSTNLGRADTPLAPEQAVTQRTSTTKKATKRRATTTGTTTTPPAAQTTTTEPGDDHGGRRSGRGSGGSGSGSSGSGSGKSDDDLHAEDD